MNAATILGSRRALRPAAATVLILAVVAGLVQNVGRAPNPSVAEPPRSRSFRGATTSRGSVRSP